MDKFVLILLSALLSYEVFALPAEAEDDPMELSTRITCQVEGTLSERKIKRIMKNALKGDSVSAMFLYNNLNFIQKGRESVDTSEWLSVAKQNNPIAYMYLTFDLLRDTENKNFEEGVAQLKISAELGFLEATYFLVEVYEGEMPGFESYANPVFAQYWRKRYALSGNLFHLKEFVFDNPNNLSEHELNAWREAYLFIKSIKKRTIADTSNLSSNAQWLVRLFNKNKQNLRALLEHHHEVYAGYKYCMNK